MSRRLVAAAAAAVLVACTGGGDDDAAPPRPVEITEPAPLVDRSGIVLAPVGGSTTSTIVEAGTARVVGTVRGPTGPVPGATVRIERITAGGQQGTDVLTDADGRFELSGAPGGRYRVRAFLAPALVQTVAEVRFLADAQEHSFDLVVEDRRGLVVRADAAPKPPVAGEPVNVVVLVASRVVDADGVVRHQPLGGRLVELVGLGRWQLLVTSSTDTTSTAPGPSPPSTEPAPSSTEGVSVRTDSAGRARFELVCTVAGAPGLALLVPVTVAPPAVTTTSTTSAAPPTSATPLTTTETVALELPDCVAPGGPPTTAEPSSSTEP